MALIRGLLEPEPQPFFLGIVWVKCPAYPALALGLASALRRHAHHVHLGQRPPLGAPPSFLILCSPEEEEDLASELERLRTLNPEATMLVFGLRPELGLAKRALKAGASGLIHLGQKPEQIVRALSLAREGETILPRELLKDALQEQQAAAADLSNLTLRQQETLELLAQGHTNAAIAKRLFLSEDTIKQHLRGAYKALGVENRTQAARAFRRSSSSCEHNKGRRAS